MEAAPTVGVAVALFAATNVDDLFLLVAFFADPRRRPGAIVAGQSLGIAVLVAASLAASLVSRVLPAPWVGLLGLVPLARGIAGLTRRWRDAPPGNTADRRSASAV